MTHPIWPRGFKAADVSLQSGDTIRYDLEQLGSGGSKTAATWRDARGFRRLYIAGHETHELARKAAVEGAGTSGYVAPRWWKFLKTRLALKA